MDKIISFDDPAMGLVPSERALAGMPTQELKSPRVPIDLQELLASALLIQANSGGGKTWAGRRLLEQTFGMVQHIVIDPEGEMHTLREQHDYVLAAPQGGDCIASVQSAPVLARRVMELGVSIIIDVYDLGTKRAEFVKAFLEAIMNLPRDVWHPAMFVIDEAHKFCPERSAGEAASTEAVKDLMTRGRKRGWGRVLSTQRISELHKSAAAECNNRLIGRTALDNDQARAAKALGMKTSSAAETLAGLATGHFFAFGPALCKTVTEIKVGTVQTTHERAGARRRGPTPPRERVRQVLAQLADLPAEAEKEAKTVVELQERVRRFAADNLALKRQLEESHAGIGTSDQVVVLEKEVGLLRANERVLRDRLTLVQHLATSRGDRLIKLREVISGLYGDIVESMEIVGTEDDTSKIDWTNIPEVAKTYSSLDHAALAKKFKIGAEVLRPVAEPAVNGHEHKAADKTRIPLRILAALAHRGPLTKHEIVLVTNYARGGHVDRAFAEIEKNGWWTRDGDKFAITEEGKAALGVGWTPPPGGAELRKVIADGLNECERKIFHALCSVYPSGLTKSAIIEATGYARGGHVDRAFATLSRRRWAVKSGKQLVIAKELF